MAVVAALFNTAANGCRAPAGPHGRTAVELKESPMVAALLLEVINTAVNGCCAINKGMHTAANGCFVVTKAPAGLHRTGAPAPAHSRRMPRCGTAQHGRA